MPTKDVSLPLHFRRVADRLRRATVAILSWRPGIAAQLGAAFVGVAVLAAVANFAVQRTISITTTRTVPARTAPVQSKAEPPQPQASPAASAEPLKSGAALAALERFVHVVETAMLMPPAARADLVNTAASELRTEIISLRNADAGRGVDAALAAGLDFTDIVTRRTAAFEEYAAALARIDGNLQESLDRAWKVLGRVVARQSLVAVDRQFKELRREAELLRHDSYSANDAQRLEELEAQFGAALMAGERSLSKNRADWYVRTVEDFRVLGPRRDEVLRLDAQRVAALQRFQDRAVVLRADLLRPASVRKKMSPQPVDSNVRRLSGGVPPAGTTTFSPFEALPPWQVFPTDSTTHEEQQTGIAPRSLAWLSAGVLALLLAASVGAVFSVLRRTRQLQHQADHDALTQLPNRRQLFERLRNQIGRAQQHGRRFGVFFLDLDNFKNINDGMGHGFGDRVLLAIAGRLRSIVGDRGIAARFGGDEFTVVVESEDDDTEALRDFGCALVRAFQRPLSMGRRELLVSVSVGGAFYPEHGPDAESLLRAADAAMFRAKALGRSQLFVFTPELLEAAASRFTTEQGLRHAIDRGELELYFQPEVDLATLAVDVCEALLRWRTPGGELVLPDQFLSVAEESGLIFEINEWVLRSAICAASRWRSAGHTSLRVAVNISSRQFFDAGFPERVRALLLEHRLPAEALEIELTETVLQTGASTIDGLRQLQELGVAVALDDFGTGYSSLASLEQLPLTRVKLDRSLIAGIDVSARSAAIANAIIRLCHDLGVEVTAEGVERGAQLAMLREHRIHLQGYLLSRPLSEALLEEALELLPARLQSLLLESSSASPLDVDRALIIPSSADPRSRRPETAPLRHR